MADEATLNFVMLIEVGLLVFAAAVYFAHGLWLFVTQKRTLQQMTAARTSIARLLTRGEINVEEIEALRRVPRGVQVAAFLEISRTQAGSGKDRLRFVAREVSLLDRARKLCESRLWTRRLRGMRLLAGMDVADPIVEKLFTDPHPAVRAQAAEWAAAHPSPAVITAMLKMLADPATQARFAVQDALLRMGAIVAAPLAAFLETHSGSPAESGLRVAGAVAEASFLPAALRLSAAPESGVRVASANLLGAIGSAASADRLTELLKDEDPRVRAAAANGLGRMQHWPAASQLADSLRDSTWQVRRDAALALRSIGAPGMLFLRRALKGDDAFAADMAEQILGLPATATG